MKFQSKTVQRRVLLIIPPLYESHILGPLAYQVVEKRQRFRFGVPCVLEWHPINKDLTIKTNRSVQLPIGNRRLSRGYSRSFDALKMIRPRYYPQIVTA